MEVLFITIYGFANRYREGKRPNDLLLASVIPVINDVGLPFVICGDFNEPLHKLPAYQYFRDLGAVEAFQWYFSKNGVQLPPTCGGSTRNDSAIFHPVIACWIESMKVPSEHQMDMHTPLFIQLRCQSPSISRDTWHFPKSWAHIAPSTDRIAECYTPVPFASMYENGDNLQADDMEQALQVWTKHVETAVHRAISKQHCDDPAKFPDAHLHASYKGRCNFPRLSNLTKNL